MYMWVHVSTFQASKKDNIQVALNIVNAAKWRIRHLTGSSWVDCRSAAQQLLLIVQLSKSSEQRWATIKSSNFIYHTHAHKFAHEKEHMLAYVPHIYVSNSVKAKWKSNISTFACDFTFDVLLCFILPTAAAFGIHSLLFALQVYVLLLCADPRFEHAINLLCFSAQPSIQNGYLTSAAPRHSICTLVASYFTPNVIVSFTVRWLLKYFLRRYSLCKRMSLVMLCRKTENNWKFSGLVTSRTNSTIW